jgi:hypothetical protein
MPITPGSHRIRSRSFGLREHSTEHWESAERHVHSRQRWQVPRSPSGDSDTGQVTELGGHHKGLVGQGIGLETAG